jgi:hypothetical protein
MRKIVSLPFILKDEVTNESPNDIFMEYYIKRQHVGAAFSIMEIPLPWKEMQQLLAFNSGDVWNCIAFITINTHR